jgi:hypothetical protein
MFQENEGVVPRTVRELFTMNSDNCAEIFVSFVEIYNEGVYDLLSTTPTRKIQARGTRDIFIKHRKHTFFYSFQLSRIWGCKRFLSPPSKRR